MNMGFNALNFAVLHEKAVHHGLPDIQVRLGFNDAFHPLSIEVHIVLRPGTLDCQTFFRVQSSELNPCLVCVPGHLSAKSVNLLDQVSFGKTTDSRVAAHGSDVIEIDGEKKGGVAHPGCSQCSLTAGMTGADYSDVVLFLVGRQASNSIRRLFSADAGDRDTAHDPLFFP
jgi:hypothetical protein